MEHIVQFGISIDDKTIQKKLEENAYKDIVNRIAEDAENGLKRINQFYKEDRIDWDYYVNEAIDRLIDANRDQIIERTVELLKNSYVRTKAYREAMKNAISKA